jgi:opine dehydrogenase
MNKVTIIGGGGTGHTLAADLSRRGYDVSLCELPEYSDCLVAAKAAGGVEVTGALPEGFVKVHSVAPDFDESVANADLILVSVVANRHRDIARRIGPLLRDGQSILIGPDNGGSLVFAKEFHELGMDRDVLIGGLGGNFYACRLIGPASVLVGMPAKPKKIAAFPAASTGKLIASLGELFQFTPGENVLEMALSTPNIPNHLAGAILNTGAVESSGGNFNLFRDGLTPGVLQCIDAVAAERNAIMSALGYAPINSPVLRRVAQLDQHPELDLFRSLAGPSDMRHRYVTEDAEIGITLLVSLGRMLSVDTPVSAGLLSIASAINQTDYYTIGRSVSSLDIKGTTIWDINQYLQSGLIDQCPDIPPLM